MTYKKAVLNVQLFAIEDVITTSNSTVVEVPYGGDPLNDSSILPPQSEPCKPAGFDGSTN